MQNFFDGRLTLKQGNIIEENVEAIVNPANWTLLGGGGVDGIIHAAGGSEILDECRHIRETEFPDGLPTGKAVITSAGKLPQRCVIHTVGPIYGQNNGKDAELLSESYTNCLNIAAANQIASIAFPAISTGAFGYPKHLAAPVAASAVSAFINSNNKPESIPTDIRLVFYNPSELKVFLKNSRL